MTKFMARAALAASVSVLALGAAQAGGIINSSQSSVFNGMAYAGFAAPGSSTAATMFFNPATMTGFTRITLDSNFTFGMPSTKMTGAYTGASAALNPARPGSSGDIGMDYFVPASYLIVPINDRLTFGMSLNTTYGNTTKPEAQWLGSFLTHTSKLRVLTATPSLAYKINNEWSVGFGLQVQYASARQFAFTPPAGAATAGIHHADGVGIGWTAGVTWTPTKTTQIGLGWRSFIDQPLKGKAILGPLVAPNAEGTLNLPNRVNLSIRQGVSEKLDILGSVEWQNFGRIGDAALKNLILPAMNPLQRLPFGYSDGWVFALGGEYKYNQALTLRAGVAYEATSVKDSIRRVSLPDNDRIWLSTGFTYNMSERLAVNGSYSFLHIKKAHISQPGPLGGTFEADARGHAHLVSFGLTSKWGAPPAREAAVIRKY